MGNFRGELIARWIGEETLEIDELPLERFPLQNFSLPKVLNTKGLDVFIGKSYGEACVLIQRMVFYRVPIGHGSAVSGPCYEHNCLSSPLKKSG